MKIVKFLEVAGLIKCVSETVENEIKEQKSISSYVSSYITC